MADEPYRASRRTFLRASVASAGSLALGCARSATHAASTPEMPAARAASADVTIRIAPVLVELAPHRILSTVGYNGSVPAPLLRLREGHPVSVDLINETDTPELVHWHGQLVPSDIDGASEEGTPHVPPHGTLRYTLTPRPSGTRWVHTHTYAGSDLHRGTYTGQFGFVYVEPANEPGRYDREVFLATHEWEPFFGAEEMEEGATDAEESANNGLEVGYRLFSINGKALGHGEPVRVKQGERVMFRILNASATEDIELALPGHTFEVLALDGNAVPVPRKVSVLALGVAERIDAIVEMNHPGVWILGTPRDDDRRRGMGIVVEYAGASGPPRWTAPPPERWDYVLFGNPATNTPVDATIRMVFRKIPGGPGGFNRWTINGETYDESTPIRIHEGRRYRLVFDNQSDDDHPVHLHRHLFELVDVYGRPTSGIMKDTVVVLAKKRVTVEFVANDPGATLFHCHQVLHMDFGFMRLFTYA